MIKWPDIPRDKRQTTAGLIDSSCSSCKVKDHYLKRAKDIGLIAALPIIEAFEDHQPQMLGILKEWLDEIDREKLQKCP